MLVAINTDPDHERAAWSTIDGSLHAEQSALTCIYSTDPAQVGRPLTVESRNGKAVRLTVPAAGVVIYE